MLFCELGFECLVFWLFCLWFNLYSYAGRFAIWVLLFLFGLLLFGRCFGFCLFIYFGLNFDLFIWVFDLIVAYLGLWIFDCVAYYFVWRLLDWCCLGLITFCFWCMLGLAVI